MILFSYAYVCSLRSVIIIYIMLNQTLTESREFIVNNWKCFARDLQPNIEKYETILEASPSHLANVNATL